MVKDSRAGRYQRLHYIKWTASVRPAYIYECKMIHDDHKSKSVCRHLVTPAPKGPFEPAVPRGPRLLGEVLGRKHIAPEVA